jgi:hypothetical protein
MTAFDSNDRDGSGDRILSLRMLRPAGVDRPVMTSRQRRALRLAARHDGESMRTMEARVFINVNCAENVVARRARSPD